MPLQRRVLFSSTLPKESLHPASNNTLLSIIKFAADIGFKTRTPRLPRRKSLGVLDYYAELSRSFLVSCDVFLTAYPYICGSIFSDNPLRTLDRNVVRFLRRLRPERPSAILFIVDLPIEQAYAASGTSKLVDGEANTVEREFFENFDVLCVFNDAMKRAIMHRHKILAEKFVEFEILDHATTFVPPQEPRRRPPPNGRWKIAYAGNYSKKYVGDWIESLPECGAIQYEMFGLGWEWLSALNRSDISNNGFLRDEGLLRHLSRNSDFGIINPPSDAWASYYNYGTTSKMGTYLAAGLPILVSSKCEYISSLVAKYKVGISFDKLDEIPWLVSSLSRSDYELMRESCLVLGEKVRSGYFFKRAINLAIEKTDHGNSKNGLQIYQ